MIIHIVETARFLRRLYRQTEPRIPRRERARFGLVGSVNSALSTFKSLQQWRLFYGLVDIANQRSHRVYLSRIKWDSLPEV